LRDIELYRAILGLSAPWTVVSVDLDIKGQQVTVRVDPGPGPFPCPECGTSGLRYDSKPRRPLPTRKPVEPSLVSRWQEIKRERENEVHHQDKHTHEPR
jgi:hypothetical protein